MLFPYYVVQFTFLVVFHLKDSCPSIDENHPIKASLLPFEISRSKRSLEVSEGIRLKHRRLFRRSVTYHPLVKTLSPDSSFDWNSFMQLTRKTLDDDKNTTKKETRKLKNYKIVPITMDLIHKLGVLVLPSRRLCFGGEIIKGIILPSNTSLQIQIIKRFLIWFSPCLEDKGNALKLNEQCLHQRQNRFLKMYLHSHGIRF